MRPPTTATLEKPAPRPVAVQSFGGPPAGHDVSRPVSVETPSRFGPRHCGQLPPGGAAEAVDRSQPERRRQVRPPDRRRQDPRARQPHANLRESTIIDAGAANVQTFRPGFGSDRVVSPPCSCSARPCRPSRDRPRRPRREVVARHVTAMGGEAAFKAIKSMRARGTFSMVGAGRLRRSRNARRPSEQDAAACHRDGHRPDRSRATTARSPGRSIRCPGPTVMKGRQLERDGRRSVVRRAAPRSRPRERDRRSSAARSSTGERRSRSKSCSSRATSKPSSSTWRPACRSGPRGRVKRRWASCRRSASCATTRSSRPC